MGAGQATQRVKDLGNEAFKNEKYEEAINYYNLAIKHNKDNYLVYSNRCFCYLKLSQYGNAYLDALKIINICPIFSKGYYRLATVYENAGMIYDAYIQYKKAQALELKNTQIIGKIKEMEKILNEKPHLKHSRPSVLTWGSNASAACGIKNKAFIQRPSAVQELNGINCADVACGIGHCLVVTEINENDNTGGDVYVWGINTQFQCGINDVSYIRIEEPILHHIFIPLKIIAVSAGAAHSIALTREGQIYSWGVNTFGQCGIDDVANDNFIRIPTINEELKEVKIRGIACGLAHSFFLSDEGDVFCCGWNSNGQLGIWKKEINMIKIPQKLQIFTKISHIACGGNHTLLVTKENGDVYAFGSNSCGQLGHGTYEDVFKPIKINRFCNENIHITMASCGEEFSVAISIDNRIFSFGLNNSGQLGSAELRSDRSAIPIEITSLGSCEIEEVCCGKAQAMAINSNGIVYYWGLPPFEENNPDAVPQKPQIMSTFGKEGNRKEIAQIKSGRDFFCIMLCATDPQKCFATGKPLNGTVEAGTKCNFHIKTVDKNGNFRNKGGDRINTFVTKLNNGEMLKKELIDIIDESNGDYMISMKLKDTGHFEAHVFCNGEPIRNSPFLITAVAGKPEKCITKFMPCAVPREKSGSFAASAGELTSLTLELYDKFNNRCLSNIAKRENIDFDIKDVELRIDGVSKEIGSGTYTYRQAGDVVLLNIKFLRAKNVKIEVFYKKKLSPIHVDYSLIEGNSNIDKTDALNINIKSDLACAKNCKITGASFQRFPIDKQNEKCLTIPEEEHKTKQPTTPRSPTKGGDKKRRSSLAPIDKSYVKAGEKNFFVISHFDQYGNSTNLKTESFNIIVTKPKNKRNSKRFSTNTIDTISTKISEMSSKFNISINEVESHFDTIAFKELPHLNATRVEFTVNKSGFYDVEITMGNEEILGEDTKFRFYVKNSKVDYVNSQVKPDGIYGGEIKKGKPIERILEFIARDEYRNLCEYVEPDEIIANFRVKEHGFPQEKLGRLEVLSKFDYIKSLKENKKMNKLDFEGYKNELDDIKDKEIGNYIIKYKVSKPGLYQILLKINGFDAVGAPFLINYSRDTKEIEEELRMLERKQKKYEEAQRKKREDDEIKRKLEDERRKKMDEEEKTEENKKLSLDLELKKAEVQRNKRFQEERETRDIKKREMIIKRVQRIQELETKFEEERKALLERLKIKMEKKPPKLKRMGGGFVVAFDVESPVLKLQNFIKNE